MKAAGFNATSLYFDWDYHSPAPGVYDFTGVRDVDRLLDMAQEAGLYVIARPAPYINAEVDSGGLPGWLTTKAENNRSDDPRFLKYADQWLTQIDRILRRHQLTNGTGSVIAYQVENEYYNGYDGRPRVHAAPRGQGPRRRHHRPADGQQQRHVQLRRRQARRRRPGLVPAGLRLLATRRSGTASRTSATTTRPAGRCTRPSSRAARSTRGAARATTSARS